MFAFWYARPVLVAALVSVTVLALSACGTIAGFGRDTQAAGQAIEETAEDVAN